MLFCVFNVLVAVAVNVAIEGLLGLPSKGVLREEILEGRGVSPFSFSLLLSPLPPPQKRLILRLILKFLDYYGV